MKKRLLYIYVPLIAALFLWACGGGSLEWAENDDILALEKFDNMTEAEILTALDDCVARGECDKESSEAFRRSLLAKDTAEDDTLESSSSSLDLFASSSSADTSAVSSSAGVLSSSSGSDLVSSSSGLGLSSSSVSLSSSVVTSSSNPVVSSSSLPLISSSSLVLSSSSFVIKLSSSSTVVETSSSEVEDLCTKALLGQGQCTADKASINLGGEATWTYVPVVECGPGLTASWMLTEADVPRATGLSAKYKFTDDNLVNEKVYPTVTLKRGALSTTVECDKAQVKILAAGPGPVSSSSVKSSSSVSSSSVKSSSSIIPITDECKVDPMDNTGTIWLCQKPGRESEQCNYVSQKWVCPTGPVVSSSSIVPSSSSVVPPSSSSVVSSSSVEPPPQSSSSDGFVCNDGNSTLFAQEEEKETQAGGCAKYTMNQSNTVQIGCWWNSAPPVDVTLQKCDGSVVTISHQCNGWLGVDVGGTCTIYLKPENGIRWKFNNF